MPHFLPPEKRGERDAELEMTQEFEPSYSKGWTEQVKRIYGSAIVKNWNRVQFFEGVSRLETRSSFFYKLHTQNIHLRQRATSSIKTATLRVWRNSPFIRRMGSKLDGF
jgi:hypothetical protein